MHPDTPPIVLVIDDHDDGRDSLCMILKLWGYLPIPAKTSVEALLMLEKGLRPCLVLLDLIMPGDGWHFRSEQMAHPEWKHISVIVGSAFGKPPPTIAQDIGIPEDHVLVKPMDLDRFAEVLRRHCPPPAAA